MLGRRKTRGEDGVREDSRKASSGMARGGEKSGGRDTPPCSDDDVDRRDEEEEEDPRDILAVCKHGNSMGIAAVRPSEPWRKLIVVQTDRHSTGSAVRNIQAYDSHQIDGLAPRIWF